MRYSKLILSRSPKVRFQAAEALAPSWAPLAGALLLPLLIQIVKGLREPPSLGSVDRPAPPSTQPVLLDPKVAEGIAKGIQERLSAHTEPRTILEQIKTDLRAFGPFVETIPPAELEGLASTILLASVLSWQKYIPVPVLGEGLPETTLGQFEVRGWLPGKKQPYVVVSSELLGKREAARYVVAHELGHWVNWLLGREHPQDLEEAWADAFAQVILGEQDEWLWGKLREKGIDEAQVRQALREANLSEFTLKGLLEWHLRKLQEQSTK